MCVCIYTHIYIYIYMYIYKAADLFEDLGRLAKIKEQVKYEMPHLQGKAITAEVRKRNDGIGQSNLWSVATKEGWVLALRVICPAVSTRVEGYKTASKLKHMILQTMGTVKPVLDIYMSMYDEGAQWGQPMQTTAYIRILAEHIRWAMNLMNTLNMYKIGNHLLSCTLEDSSTRPWDKSKRVHAQSMETWNFVLKDEASPQQAQVMITDRDMIKQCNGKQYPQQQLEVAQAVYDNSSQVKGTRADKRDCQILALAAKPQSPDGHGKWTWANELNRLKESLTYKYSMMWLKDKNGNGLAELTRMIIRAHAHQQLLCFTVDANERVYGTEELLQLLPGDKILALPAVDKPFLLKMSHKDSYLQECQDEEKKHLYKDGKGTLAYIAIQYMVDDGVFNLMDCGLALGGALCRSTQASDEKIIKNVIQTLYSKVMVYLAQQDAPDAASSDASLTLAKIMEVE